MTMIFAHRFAALPRSPARALAGLEDGVKFLSSPR